MLKNQLIQEYKSRIHSITSKLEECGVKNDELNVTLSECLKKARNENAQSSNKWTHIFIPNTYRRTVFKLLFFILLIYSLNLVIEKPFNLLLCKIQEFIYPGLRLLRLFSIPIIRFFPSLTELYDETCLLQNPFFYVNDLNCWVCQDLKQVEELKVVNHDSINTQPPFLFNTNQKEVKFTHLFDLYNSNQKVFDRDAPKLLVNGLKYLTTHDFFSKRRADETMKASNYLWKFTRLYPIQLLKSIFPRPEIIPQLGLSTERFIAIDEPLSLPYKLPDTECNYVFVIQSKGERIIELQPTTECSDQCNTLYLKLKPPFLLWYNWWYWKPISRKVLSNTTSISYIGSYC